MIPSNATYVTDMRVPDYADKQLTHAACTLILMEHALDAARTTLGGSESERRIAEVLASLEQQRRYILSILVDRDR